ncbi:MAG: hypothetical protein ACK4N5_21830, partial [Myxococcales bacterium]
IDAQQQGHGDQRRKDPSLARGHVGDGAQAFADQRAQASNLEVTDREGLFRVSRELDAFFTDDGQTVRVQASLRERRVPVSATTNEGKVCEFTARLNGQK